MLNTTPQETVSVYDFPSKYLERLILLLLKLVWFGHICLYRAV